LQATSSRWFSGAKFRPIFASFNLPQIYDSIAPSSLAKATQFLGRSSPQTSTVGSLFNVTFGRYDSFIPTVLESRNIAFQGTLCTSGNGIGVCVGLGDNTVFGRITREVARERPALTTLQVEIRRFVFIIAALALGVDVLIVSKSRSCLFPLRQVQDAKYVILASPLGCMASSFLPRFHHGVRPFGRLCVCCGCVHSGRPSYLCDPLFDSHVSQALWFDFLID
jgi:hypothetical protein